MSRVSAEMPSRAQQSCVGTASTKTGGGGLATAEGGAVRIRGADGTLAGCTPSLTVAFIGESAMRAVSFRGPAGATLRAASGLAGGAIGFGAPGGGGVGGLKPAGGGGGTSPFAGGGGGSGLFAGGGGAGGSVVFGPGAGGGPEGLIPAGAGGVGGLKPGGGPGGRAGGAPPAGGSGFGATDGGGRTAPDAGGGGLAPGGLAPVGGAGGRLGKLMRAVSFSTGTVGRFVVRGGRVIRTVSFFGSFRSAITTNFAARPGKDATVSLKPRPECQPSIALRRPDHSPEPQESSA
jgi:hypothetical protein